jgi:hypothetical protein
MIKNVIVLGILLALISIGVSAAVIHVPSDQPNIQAGIDAAVDEDTVLVADGTYTGNGNWDLDFKGKPITVKSENGRNNCVIDCKEDSGTYHRGFYFHSYERRNSILTGFTIKNGADSAITIDVSSPTISQCLVTESYAYKGGGIGCNNSSPLIIQCSITHNIAKYGGGIAFDWGYTTEIIDCEIRDNFCFGSVYADGGGIYIEFGKIQIVNSIICDNETYALEHAGGGIFCSGSVCQIINCIIINNSSQSGGGIGAEAPNYNIINCIVRDNTPVQFFWYPETVKYSNISGGYQGIGNIDADPRFIGGDPFDFHFASDSPCIDAGTDEGAPVNDFDGNARPNGGAVDMGIFEYQGWPSVNRSYIKMPAHHFSPGDSVSCTASVWNADSAELKNYPLFVILSLLDNYYFAPSLSGFDYFDKHFPVGLTELTVLPEFTWPGSVGSASGIIWYTALTNPEMTALASEIGVFDFGWSE